MLWSARHVVRLFAPLPAEAKQQDTEDDYDDAPKDLCRYRLAEQQPGGENDQYRITVRHRDGEADADLANGDEVKEVSQQITGKYSREEIEIYKRRGDQRYIAAGVYQGNDERGCEKRNRAVRVYFMYRTFRYGNPMIDHDRRYCPHRGGKKTEQKTP